jgi:hypothetical protein
LYDLYCEQSKKKQPQWNAIGNPGNLPALYVNEERLLQSYVNAHWNTGRYRSKGILHRGESAFAGRAAGDKISLSRQVGSQSSNHLLPKK